MYQLDEARKLMDDGWSLVPCEKNRKNNFDSDILTRDYQIGDFNGDGNIAVNLQKTNLIDWDADTVWGIKVSQKLLNQSSASIVARFPDENPKEVENTHWLFTKNDDVDFDSLDLERKDLNGEKIIELRPKGITIIPPSTTPHKKTGKLYSRKWSKFLKRPTVFKNIIDSWNWANFGAFVIPLITSTNSGMLKLDACLKRYTTATDEDRFKFLQTIYDLRYPDEWGKNRDLTPKAVQRIIKSNNNEKSKTAGYKALADHFKIDPLELKQRLNWVGEVPDDGDGKKGKKTITDFYESGLDIAKLLKTEMPPVNWTVTTILPEGFGLMAGRPKAMKSWTALLLVYCVQNGLKFFDQETVQGDCCYLALEDNPRRLKDRIEKLKLSKLQHPTIITEAPYMNQGLEESIKLWAEQVSNPRLVIVDTLAKVKKTFNKNKTAYDGDSETLKAIQKLAMDMNITIMAISHLGKANFDYSWDRIQGSTGMQGISDFFWMLDRGDNSETAYVKGRGRDMEDFEYGLKWNENTWRYDFEGELKNVLMAETKKQIIDAMKLLPTDTVKPSDVIKQMGATKKNEKMNIQKTMQRMRNSMELDYGEGHGEYKLCKEDRPKERVNFEKDKVV
ncbi:AAA family ATPase [Candidatus Pelagibacter sp. HIMB1517]|uniref:AAA family ATPase n=1 Tax=Candidatus Pelagibacter sp. HIMB1517 TaxID=3413341 RepID=UPI003F8328A8